MGAESLGNMLETKTITTGAGHGYEIGEVILINGKTHRVESVTTQMIRVRRFNLVDRVLWFFETTWFKISRKLQRMWWV